MSADGKLGKKLFQIDEGSDGMAVDVKGNLYTPHGGKVNFFDADGKWVEFKDVKKEDAKARSQVELTGAK